MSVHPGTTPSVFDCVCTNVNLFLCPCLIAHVCVWSFTRGSMHFTHLCAGCTYCIWTFHCKALFISLWLWLHRSWLFHIHKLYKKLRCHPVSRGLKLRPPRWEKYRHLFKCYITNLAAGGDTFFSSGAHRFGMKQEVYTVHLCVGRSVCATLSVCRSGVFGRLRIFMLVLACVHVCVSIRPHAFLLFGVFALVFRDQLSGSPPTTAGHKQQV